MLTCAMRVAQLLLLTIAVSLAPRSARAVDRFEIQVYDGTANTPGAPGIELHLNHVASGTRRNEGSELARDGVTHFTLEPSFGLTSWWEAGAYLQTALRPDGRFDYAGMKLRSKLVTSPDASKGWRLGLNIEISRIPDRYDRDGWGSEIRPIVAWDTRSFLLVVNPILDQALAGTGASDGPVFEPAALAEYKTTMHLGLGVEYYASLGPIGSGFVPLASQEHYVYEVLNVLGIARLEINIGLGEGLTPASDRLVVKAILGYTIEPNAQASRGTRPDPSAPGR
jgi:hypothetical protein